MKGESEKRGQRAEERKRKDCAEEGCLVKKTAGGG